MHLFVLQTIEQLKEELNARVVEVSVQASPPAEDQTVLVAQLREELTAAQQDNDQLRQATDELNEKLESRSSDSKENVHVRSLPDSSLVDRFLFC